MKYLTTSGPLEKCFDEQGPLVFAPHAPPVSHSTTGSQYVLQHTRKKQNKNAMQNLKKKLCKLFIKELNGGSLIPTALLAPSSTLTQS